jgi:hypothetical protein
MNYSPAPTNRLGAPFDKLFRSIDEAHWAFELIGQTLTALGVVASDASSDQRISLTLPKPAGKSLTLNFGDWAILRFHKRSIGKVTYVCRNDAAPSTSLEIPHDIFRYKDKIEGREFLFISGSLGDFMDAKGQALIAFHAALPEAAQRFAGWSGTPYRKYHNPELLRIVYDLSSRERMLRDGLDSSPEAFEIAENVDETSRLVVAETVSSPVARPGESATDNAFDELGLGVKAALEIAEHNRVIVLKNKIPDLRSERWKKPMSALQDQEKIDTPARRLAGSIKKHAPESLNQWFETLPFPLASILRAWQATPTQDYKTKYEHLLHFFEGTAEFVSVILLSAFKSNGAVFAPHRQRLNEAMHKQNLSFNRATFGTWKLVVEYLGKQTRDLLNGNGKKMENTKNDSALCAEMFADLSLSLPVALSRKELAEIFSATNKMRNDWSGHGGVVGPGEAELRNQLLLEKVQNLRDVIADTWAETQLIQALHCRPRRGVFENEVAVLMGSNNEFLKETREMATWLDVERLYLSKKDSGNALQLLPLIQIGPSPRSAKNACYFFNRLQRDGARYISYHHTDEPDEKLYFADATEAIKLITEV